MGARSPSLTPGPPAQGSSARKTSPHNFWLQKPAGIETVEESAGAPRSPSQRTHTHRLTYSDSLSLGSGIVGRSLKGTSSIQGKTEVSGINGIYSLSLF